MSVRSEITRAIADARDRAAQSGALAVPDDTSVPPIGVERPANPEHGDWASNVAMQLAPVVRAAPMRIAETLLEHFDPPPAIAEVAVAAPGFLNFRLDPAWMASQVGPIREAGGAYGRRTASEPKRINVEFVSANPTGPLTVGNARGAFVGDVLSRVLEAVGHEVTREYYFNDYNEQIRNLGLSVLAVRRGEAILPSCSAAGRRSAFARGSRPASRGWASASTSGRARAPSTTRDGSSAASGSSGKPG
jgi:arginyl-tRNA synthetase